MAHTLWSRSSWLIECGAAGCVGCVLRVSAGDQSCSEVPDTGEFGWVEAGELADSLESVVDGVGVYVQRLGGASAGEVVAEVSLQCFEEFGVFVEWGQNCAKPFQTRARAGELVFHRELIEAI